MSSPFRWSRKHGAGGSIQTKDSRSWRPGELARTNWPPFPWGAKRLRSSPGTHDGLYWPTSEGSQEPLSPFGPFLAQADTSMKEIESQGGFMGYRFKVLTRQGGNVPGGSYDYVINGNMIAGFAMLAWPQEYRSSGVMSFL